MNDSPTKIDLPELSLGFYWRALASLRYQATPLKQAVQQTFVCGSLAPAHIQRYRKQLGFRPSPSLPLPYFYLLSQRADLSVMLQPRVRYPLPGMVHASIRVDQFLPEQAGAAFELICTITSFELDHNDALYLRTISEFRQHKRLIARVENSYLARRKSIATKPRAEPVQRLDLRHRVARWSVDGRTARQYATLSGDLNPIHLAPGLARLFGFKRTVIHGMHNLARSCSAIESHTGKALASIEGRFRQPVLLPTELDLYVEQARYQLRVGHDVGLSGQFTEHND